MNQLKFISNFVYELCTKIFDYILYCEASLSLYLQYVVEAGTGIEPVYADLQSAA